MADHELADLPTRLRRSQQDVDDARAALTARLEQRRQLVLRTVDEGAMSQRQIAKALGRGVSQVSKILATPDPDDV